MIPPGYPWVLKNVRKFWLAVWPALANIEIYILYICMNEEFYYITVLF